MKKITGFAIFGKKNNLRVISATLPIYWIKKDAIKEAAKFNGMVKKVSIVEEKDKRTNVDKWVKTQQMAKNLHRI